MPNAKVTVASALWVLKTQRVLSEAHSIFRLFLFFFLMVGFGCGQKNIIYSFSKASHCSAWWLASTERNCSKPRQTCAVAALQPPGAEGRGLGTMGCWAPACRAPFSETASEPLRDACLRRHIAERTEMFSILLF